MKRKAMLLAHVDGQLSSGKDADDVMMFLKSNAGGAWLDNEIFRKDNISLTELRKCIDDVKKAHIDYLMLYFSGHGGYVRGTVIELNPSGEEICEREISGFVTRQLNIYDCCRSYPSGKQAMFAYDSLLESRDSLSLVARDQFNKRVMEAYPQQMSLYACRKGECAYDLGNGGVYTQNLLDATKSFCGDYLLALQAHDIAYQPTVDVVAERGKNQHPDYFIAKLSSRYQLPFAINI